MGFLKQVLAVIIGVFIIISFFILLIIGIAVATGDEELIVKNNSILVFDINAAFQEQAPAEDPFEELTGNDQKKYGVIQLVNALKYAKTDDNIKGIFLKGGFPIGGTSSIKNIREALNDFKSSGKFVHAYAHAYSEKGYYLASMANKLVVSPTGGVEFNGLVAELNYYKGFFDKWSIEPEVFKVGDFKSAVEPYTRKDMSEENKLQMTVILNALNDEMLQSIAASRNIPLDELKTIQDSMKVNIPEESVSYGLADTLAYQNDLVNITKTMLSIDKEEELETVSMSRYAEKHGDYNGSGLDYVSVIVAEGTLMGDKNMKGVIGGYDTAKAIRKAREDDDVKAIVLRVNSPGGSLISSDVIWSEVEKTKGIKPIIASMSDVAASGGYYISMAADTIVAEPTTITGSIGIFAVLFNIGDFLEKEMGITTHSVKTGELSNVYSALHSLKPNERAIIQRSIEKGYDTFTSKAASGRNVTQDEIKAVASGRVWTGIDAKKHGLVDILGGLDTAINLAADVAGLEEFDVEYLPKPKSFIEQITEELQQSSYDHIIESELGEAYPHYQQIKKMKQMRGNQAILPYTISIH